MAFPSCRRLGRSVVQSPRLGVMALPRFAGASIVAPAKVLPLYSTQGRTATPGLVAHWVVPPRLASDIKWLICYVTLSRAPSLKQLVSIGLSDKIREILEAGPPEGMVQMFSTLFADKIEETRAAALRAKQNLGW